MRPKGKPGVATGNTISSFDGMRCSACRIYLFLSGDYVSRKKTHDEFVSEMMRIHPDVEVLGTYISSKTRIKCMCRKDGCEWYAVPNSLLRGTGCPKCAGNTKLSSHEIVERICGKNNSIELLSIPESLKDNVRCKCLIDGYVWTTRASYLVQGSGCPKCGGLLGKDHDTFVKQVKQIHPDIEILSKYTGAFNKVECRCKKDGYRWNTMPITLLRGSGCPLCANVARLTQGEFVARVKEIAPTIEVLSNFTGVRHKVRFRCTVCGSEWMATPSNIYAYCGCPHCHSSKGERRIANYLKSHGIQFLAQYSFDDCRNKDALSFDFFIPRSNMVIEYDGQQHFMPVRFGGCTEKQAREVFEYTQSNDRIKNDYCEANNIRIVRIPYTDFNDIEMILEKLIAA